MAKHPEAVRRFLTELAGLNLSQLLYRLFDFCCTENVISMLFGGDRLSLKLFIDR